MLSSFGPADVIACALLAVASGLMVHHLKRNDDLSVDEGYLWYGALRVREGALPVRDFRSYEPGRYVWVGAFMGMFGTSLAVVRMAAQVFYAVGVGSALIALRAAGWEWASLIALAVLLAAWAHPAHKLFDPAMLLLGFSAAVFMILRPGLESALLAGLTVGAGAVLGLNHGLYLGVALAFVTGVVAMHNPALESWRLLSAAGGGVLLGASPLWISSLASAAFARTLYERRVRAVIERGGTNLPLPLPWPWRPVPPAWKSHGRFGRSFGRWTFVAMPLLAGGGVLWTITSSWASIADHAAWVASAAVLASCLHHPFSRADLAHLSQVMPVVIVCALSSLGPGPATLPLAALMALAAGALLPGLSWKAVRAERRQDQTRLSRRHGVLLVELQKLLASHPQARDALLLLPNLVNLYPVLGRVSPVYDTYCVYPASAREQDRMLGEIERAAVEIAVIDDRPLDGREELRFSRTHPRVWSHLEASFQRLPPVEPLPGHHFFVRPRRPAMPSTAAPNTA